METRLETLLSRIDQSPDRCWPWPGTIGPGGYGRLATSSHGYTQAHRAVYEALAGSIGEGLVLDHVCHNKDLSCAGGECAHRSCVNPRHLEPVTQRKNLLRSQVTVASRNERKTACLNGHPFTTANTFHRKDRQTRECRICRAAARQKHYLMAGK